MIGRGGMGTNDDAGGVGEGEGSTGKGRFDGAAIYAGARAVEKQASWRPSRGGGRSLPRGLDAAVMGALQRDLALRTPTAAALTGRNTVKMPAEAAATCFMPVIHSHTVSTPAAIA